MCWISKEKNVMIANADIPVFKIASIRRREKVVPYFYYRGSWTYKEGNEYNNNKNFSLKNGRDGYNYFVRNAIHSYSVKNVRLTTDDAPNKRVRVYTHKTTPESHEVFNRYSQVYLVKKVVLMLCIIPKGTRYAVNEVGEIVSDSIRVVKLFKTPFTYNKDNTISKRSVERINKTLDAWENEDYDTTTA